MEKLLFMVPDVESAHEVVATLRELGVPEERIGAVANSEARIEDLPDADAEDDSDVLPAFMRGIAAGGATGMLAGIAALAFPPLGIVAAGGARAGRDDHARRGELRRLRGRPRRHPPSRTASCASTRRRSSAARS